MNEKTGEPTCLKCGLPGDQCGCEPHGIFDPADFRLCQICFAKIPDDLQLCDDCTVTVMLYSEIKNQIPS